MIKCFAGKNTKMHNKGKKRQENALNWGGKTPNAKETNPSSQSALDEEDCMAYVPADPHLFIGSLHFAEGCNQSH